jgi:hypothetical protein
VLSLNCHISAVRAQLFRQQAQIVLVASKDSGGDPVGVPVRSVTCWTPVPDERFTDGPVAALQVPVVDPAGAGFQLRVGGQLPSQRLDSAIFDEAERYPCGKRVPLAVTGLDGPDDLAHSAGDTEAKKGEHD